MKIKKLCFFNKYNIYKQKFMRKIRLSKTKANKFNESGQLLAFYAVSIIAAVLIFREENYFQTLNFFWNGYPHNGLTFFTKIFFVLQVIIINKLD